MSAASHTPGPWILGADGEKIITNYRDEHGNMTEANWLKGGWAKSVCTIRHGNWMARGEPESNARLIAAAPDLLAALKALQLQALQSSVNNPANEWGMEALALAHAAIAKAECAA